MLSDAALLARARAMMPYLHQTLENAMVVSSLSALGTGALGAICEELGDPTMAIRLLAGVEVDSGAPSRAMWELGRLARSSAVVSAAFEAGPDAVLDRLDADGGEDARAFLARFEQFLRDHGSRAQNEYDPRAPSWELRPRVALVAIDLMRQSDEAQAPAVRHAASIEERERVAADIRSKIAGDAETAALFESALRSAHLFLAGRERGKTNAVRVINETRVALYEYGRRLVERGVIDDVEQLFMVTDEELDALRARARVVRCGHRRSVDAIPSTVRLRAGVRREWPSAHARRDDAAVATSRWRRSRRVTCSQGAAGSGGVASGRARVVTDAGDPAGLEPGDVLIAPQTDPAWVPLMVPAAAVVVNVGAAGSHAMIVSRELGIPCVVSVEDASVVIPDGAMVTVDGNAGTVTIDSLPT